MKRMLAVAGLVLAVSACGTLSDDPQLAPDTACRSIGASLGTLALYRHKMAADDVARVDALARESEPLCVGENPPTGPDVMARLNQMRLDLLAAEQRNAR